MSKRILEWSTDELYVRAELTRDALARLLQYAEHLRRILETKPFGEIEPPSSSGEDVEQQ